VSVFIPTTTISVYRANGNENDNDPFSPDYGSTNTQLQGERIPASILEQNSIVSIDGALVTRDITEAIGRVYYSTDVRKGDLIYDERRAEYWAVDEVAFNHNPVMLPPKKLALHRVEGPQI